MPNSDEGGAPHYEYDPEGGSHGEKADLPEKLSLESVENRRSESGCFEQSSEETLNETPRLTPENLRCLVETSKYMFTGFQELFEGSSSLLDGLGKLIRSCNPSLNDNEPEAKSEEILPTKPDEEECSSEGSLTPLDSLVALQKASDMEKERIKQLQDQIQTMNESIQETDVFIKQCQKLNEQLTEECRKFDMSNNDGISNNQSSQLDHLTTTACMSFESTHQSILDEVASAVKRQAGDHSIPNFDRWSMLCGDQLDDSINMSRSPFTAALNLGEGEPHRCQYFASSPYDELESILESIEEEEDSN